MFLELKKCWTEPKQMLKLIILILCVCFSLYQFMDCVNKLLHPPMSTYSRFYLNETMKYPSLTICRRPGYKTYLFYKYGLRPSTDLESVRAFQTFNFNNYTVEEFLEEVTYTFEEVFKLYAYAGTGNSIPVRPAPIEKTSFYSIANGRCYTLTPQVLSDTFSVSGGYFLYFQHNVTSKKKDAFGISESGFRIYLHDSNEILTSAKEQDNSFLEYLYLETSEDMRVTLGVQEFSQVHSNDAPCVSDVGYSKSKCQERCLHRNIAASIGCVVPWLEFEGRDQYPQCSNATSIQNLLSGFLPANRNTYIENCTCHKTCNITIYTTHVINRKEMELDNFSQITIYYTSNLVTKMSEVFTYDWNVFLSDIGGSFGFLLGLSVIGFIGLVEEICQTVFKIWFKKKNDQKDEDNRCNFKNNMLNERNEADSNFSHKNVDCAEENFIHNETSKQLNKY